MSFIMPLFIILITFRLSSGLALYFTVSNIFGVGQTLVLNNPFKRKREQEEAELFLSKLAQLLQDSPT